MTWPPIPVMHGHGDPTQFATNHLPQYQGFIECVLTTNNCIYAGESEPSTFFRGRGGAILGMAGCIHKINRQTMHFLGLCHYSEPAPFRNICFCTALVVMNM